jgi:bifunctional non-homologous end joining protein LigD
MKTKPVTNLRPQLASRGDWESKISDPLWVGEEKFDGTRYLAAFTKRGVRIVSRRGIDKTDRLPKLVAELERAWAPDAIATGTVLDGEIVAGSFSETISLVNSLGSRGMDSSTSYHFMVFDILREGRFWYDGLKFRDRRLLLERVLRHVPGGDRRITTLTPQFNSDSIDNYLQAIWAAGGEGIILKNLDGRYEQGKRSRLWIKVKAVQTADGVITGFTPGEGKYQDTIGAIVIGQYRADRFVPKITKISGMTDQLRYEIGSNGSDYLGKVVEFAYQNKTDESYRHPRFKRFREDKTQEECIWEES